METAYRFWISQILNSRPIFEEEKFAMLELQEKKVTRVNIMANVVEKYQGEKPYSSLTIDDASGQMRVKSFERNILENVNIGDSVVVIGNLRFFNNEIYIMPDIIRKISPQRIFARKLELGETEEIKQLSRLNQMQAMNAEPEKIIQTTEEGTSEEKQENKEIIETSKELILNMIRASETVGIEEIIMKTNLPVEEINHVIAELLEQSIIYEPMPSKLRLL